jgi:hypothetical protein
MGESNPSIGWLYLPGGHSSAAGVIPTATLFFSSLGSGLAKL